MTAKTVKKPAAKTTQPASKPKVAKTRASKTKPVEKAGADPDGLVLITTDGDGPSLNPDAGDLTTAADRPEPADKPRSTSLFGKHHPIIITLEIPGYVPRANREIPMNELRNGALSDQVIRDLLEELLAQF